MKAAIGCFIGLVFVVCAAAEPLLEGRVRLESGEPVADAQVRIFDMSDLRQGAIARAMTDGTGYFSLPLAALAGQALPARFALGANYPNPFNPSTIIPYQLAASSEVRLEVFNLLGQHIATLVDGERAAGFHTATWHATDGEGRAVGAGVYIYRMTVGMESQTGRMVLIDGQAGVSAGGAVSVWSGVSSGDGSTGGDAQVYGLVISGEGLVPYVDSAFRVESGMAPVELEVSEGLYSAGKVTDDDCPLCDFLGDGEHTIEDGQGGHTAPEADETEEEAADETEEEAADETEEEEEDDGSEEEGADLIVHPPIVSSSSVPLGNNFRIEVYVENIGAYPAESVWVRFYRSDDETIDPATDRSIFDFDPPADGASMAASESWNFSVSHQDEDMWDEAGTYYVGVCVDPVPGETNINNNCSVGVRVIVEDRGNPDLIVRLPEVGGPRRTNRFFDIRATVRNIGAGRSTETVLRYYRSDGTTIDATDTQVGTNGVEKIAADRQFSDIATVFEAPTSPGTYYYGACVDPVPGESDTNNNCSEAVPINVGVPDLAFGLAWVSTSVPVAGESFTLMATVRNQGPGEAASTTLRYYRSDDTTIDATDTPIGTDAVSSLTAFDGVISGPFSRLAASGTSQETISVSAPSSSGMYYYGACVDGVPGEANTDNNCSTGVYVRVVPSGEDPFNIELVFFGDFIDEHKEVMQQAARRWETIITEGLTDVNFSANPHNVSLQSETIVVNDTVDDVRIFVGKSPTGSWGSAQVNYTRSGNPIGLPALGTVMINSSAIPRYGEHDLMRDLMLHEIAHVLGFGTFIWSELGLRHNPYPSSDPSYFSGELAIQAFNAAGGENYSGSKVPVDRWHNDHWDPAIFGGLNRVYEVEIMELDPRREHVLSEITIQSLADLGYVVDVSRADPFRLPASISTMRPLTASAKPVASQYCDLGDSGPIYVGDDQGSIIRTIGD